MKAETLKLFTLIHAGLLTIPNIKRSWIAIANIDLNKKEVHFTKLSGLSDEKKCDFVQSMILIHGDIDRVTVSGIQVKQQGGRGNYISKNFKLLFESDEQKEQYLRYKYVIHNLEFSKEQFEKEEKCI